MFNSLRKWIVVAGVISLTAGCSTMRAPSDSDPLEGFNRGVHGFNEVLDQVALRPLALGYNAITAPEVRTCVNNFFSNLEDIAIAFNNLMQGKPKAAGSDLCRFALNSTIGILGLVDVASELGFQKNDEDFGQTLGVWGVRSGPYLVLPVLGPSSLRDASGRVVDSPLDPVRHHDDVSERNALAFVEAVDKRARLLPATDLIDRVALDKYAFIRDAYLARRESLVRDGAPSADDLKEREEYDDGAQLQEWQAHPPFKAALDAYRPAPVIQQSGFTLPADLQQSQRAKVVLGLEPVAN